MGVDLSATLPDLLARKGWTQERLADETGIRRTDINRLANGKIPAGRDRLSRIAAALDVSERELDPRGSARAGGPPILARLEAVEDRQREGIRKFDAFVKATTARLAALEGAQAQQEPPSVRRSSPKRGQR
jgi:transcriptional regulator with XRE-family HTH domain